MSHFLPPSPLSVAMTNGKKKERTAGWLRNFEGINGRQMVRNGQPLSPARVQLRRERVSDANCCGRTDHFLQAVLVLMKNWEKPSESLQVTL